MKAVEPEFAKFFWSDGFAPFLITHVGQAGDLGPDGDALSDDEAEHLRSGWVLCADPSNDVGLADGWNRRDKIGHGGKGVKASWAYYD